MALLFLTIGSLNAKADSEFYYDKKEVNVMFQDIETKNSGFLPLQSAFIKQDSADFTFYDLEIQSFCTGFCCGPVGLYTVAVNKKRNEEEKKSFWVGFCSAGTMVLLLIPTAILLENSFFFF